MAAQKKRKTTQTQATPAVEFDFTRSPIHLLRRAQQRALEIFNREVGASGLTPRQFIVLLAVQENEGLTQTDLVNRTRIDRSTLADMISRLIKRELLGRSRTERDQRANAVTITAAGRRALKAALSRVRSAEERLLEAVPESRRAAFLDSLGVLAQAESTEQPEPKAAPRRAARPAAKTAAPAETPKPKAKPAAQTGRARGKAAAVPTAAAAPTPAPAPAKRAAPARRGKAATAKVDPITTAVIEAPEANAKPVKARGAKAKAAPAKSTRTKATPAAARKVAAASASASATPPKAAKPARAKPAPKAAKPKPVKAERKSRSR